MKRALFITLNEVRLYLQDKGDLAFSLLLPVLTFALMYGAFGGETMFKAAANVVDEDGGIYSQQLIEKLDAIDGISIDLLSAADADAKLERSDILIALYIPSGFSDTLAAGGKAELLFKQRGNGGLEGQILAGIIRSVAAEIDQEFQVLRRVEINLEDEQIPGSDIELTVQNLLEEERQQPALGVTEEVVGGSTEFINQYLPGIITMYVLFAISMGARSIVEERRRGTLERLLTTRLNTGELFSGKFIANIARGFIQTFILLILSYAVFRMFTPISFLSCLVISLVFAASASAMGMIIAAISRTEEAANWIAVVVTMFMVMMGNTFFQIPEDSVLGAFSTFSLNTYANEAYTTIIAGGGSLGDVWLPLAILAAVAVVGLVISRMIFRAVPGSK
ncbi:MAG: ABC transporter permease [Dehalococcoidales bacterium]|nr:ABC transporter permease [Dehalococcoidales bacterium]